MSVIRIKIEPKVIIDAVLKSNRDMEEVKERYRNFDKWINKELDPTFNQLNELSRFLRVPFGYLLLETPVTEEIPLLQFRTVDTDAIQKPSRELIDTIHDMERKQAWLRDIYNSEGRGKLDFVGSLRVDKDTDQLLIAERIRAIMGLEKNWYEKANSRLSTFQLLRTRLSENGIMIMQNGIALNNTHRPLNINEFRAFTLIDEFAPLIFINSLDTQNGKAFSLLHELVHIFFGRDSLYNDDLTFRNKYTNPLEIICNKVSGELIAPMDVFVTYWEKDYRHLGQSEKIAVIADEFRVSKIVIARKALDKRFINRHKYMEVVDIVRKEFELSRRKEKRSGGGNAINNVLSRIDRNFLRTLINSVQSGNIQHTEAYRLAGVGRGVFEEMMTRLKGVR